MIFRLSLVYSSNQSIGLLGHCSLKVKFVQRVLKFDKECGARLSIFLQSVVARAAFVAPLLDFASPWPIGALLS